MSNIDRTKGSKYPISIGTSTALESFFGVSDTMPAKRGKPPYMQYQCILLNVRTLARNFLSSYKANDLINVTTAELYQEFKKELILISNIVSDQSRDNIKLSIYNLNAINLKRSLRRANFKAKYTAKQQYIIDVENAFSDHVTKDVNLFSDYFNYEVTTDIIRHGLRRNIIVTHYPTDLLFTALDPDLLESHTGKIKKSFEFNTKLKNAPDDVPFNKYTLQIFGDSSGYILPYSSAMRKELTEICKNLPAISPVMQDKKFLKSVKTVSNNELTSLLNAM